MAKNTLNKDMLKLFMHWINERHKIYLKKKEGASPPWTRDKILQEYKFTNVFRVYDAVTQDLMNNVITPHLKDEDQATLLFNIMKYRFFNWPPTFYALGGYSDAWNEKVAKKLLKEMKKRGDQIFTGAYIITNSGKKRPKTDIICEALTAAWNRRETFVEYACKVNTLEMMCEALQVLPTVGKFIAYEIVTDLRHTRMLDTARDVFTWANPGPGAKRGLNRLHNREVKRAVKDTTCVTEMRELLEVANKKKHKHVPKLEMRDIEHSLCEFDKYMRVKQDEGRPRSKYNPKEKTTRGF